MGRNQSAYTDEFREQIVKLVNSGKAAMEVAREYGIAKTTVYGWVRNHAGSGSFRARDNMSDTERELASLRKENKRLQMEVEVLKKTAIIMARK